MARLCWYASLLVAVAESTAEALELLVDAQRVAHAVNPLYMGCHSDSGFVHEVTGWSSQMLFGESFEVPPNTTRSGQSSYAWQPTIDPSLSKRASIKMDESLPFAGMASQKVSIAAGDSSGTAGLANRGLGNEGLYIVGGKEYEGYFFARSTNPVTLEIRLERISANGTRVLASKRMRHAGGPSYVQHNFTLLPSEGTECVGIPAGSDATVHCTKNIGTAHVCVKCSGQFVVAVVAESPRQVIEVNLDYVVLQPGPWGRFAGLNARADVAAMLKQMGIKAIRLGGSFCSVTKDNGLYYQWQRWTGPVWKRPSVGAHWDSYGGNAYNLIGGWGPFEMIDYAVALGAEPIITTTMTSTPESFADLVAYCWANASDPMGAKRIADGHPQPYRLRFIELGNEQYNNNYLEQVAAMEKRAAAVGAADTLHYMFPSNSGLNADDARKAADLRLGHRLVTDLHVGASGALPVASELFASHSAAGLKDDAAVNFETNAGTHHHGRALAEAADLNDFFNAGNPRMLARTASFCHGRSGHFDMCVAAYPAMHLLYQMTQITDTWPPGHVHAMITATWQPGALNTTVSGPTQQPVWTTVRDKGLTCSASEYAGDLGTTSAAGCLAAAQKKGGVNYAIWHGESNKNCYVCAITDRGSPSSWPLTPEKGAVSFYGEHVLQPYSVSAQRSLDKQTVAIRVVNSGSSSESAIIRFTGFSPKSASATSIANNDLAAENTPADINRVSPRPLSGIAVTANYVSLTLPPFSYTVVEAKSRS